jgi:hypothetical protein
VTTLAALTILLVPAAATRTAGASSPTQRNWEASYGYMKQLARKQHLRADDLQHRLTRRVLEVRRLQGRIAHIRRVPLHRADSLEAIRLASIAYGVDQGQMMAIASCETGGSFNRYSKNPSSSASGLFQFLTGTFAGTPYGRESIWSPYANALAAGWMMAHGRRGEWVC